MGWICVWRAFPSPRVLQGIERAGLHAAGALAGVFTVFTNRAPFFQPVAGFFTDFHDLFVVIVEADRKQAGRARLDTRLFRTSAALVRIDPL